MIWSIVPHSRPSAKRETGAFVEAAWARLRSNFHELGRERRELESRWGGVALPPPGIPEDRRRSLVLAVLSAAVYWRTLEPMDDCSSGGKRPFSSRDPGNRIAGRRHLRNNRGRAGNLRTKTEPPLVILIGGQKS